MFRLLIPMIFALVVMPVGAAGELVTADHPCMGYRGWAPPGGNDTDEVKRLQSAECVAYRERYWRLLSAEIDALIDSPYLPYDRWSSAQVAEARTAAAGLR